MCQPTISRMKISKVEPSQRKEGRWLVWLEDGSLIRIGDGDVVAHGLYAGMELNDEAAAALLDAAALHRMKQKALNALTARPLSRKELTRKLTARPRPDRNGEKGELPPQPDLEPQAEAVADWLEGLGLLNDLEYAKNLVRHYERKGYGPRKIRDELYRRGVPREYWDEALEEREGSEEAIDAFLRARLKGALPEGKELKRVTDALARRGFSWPDIAAGLRRYGAEVED